MYNMFIATMAFLGFVVVCGSYPGFREELQLKVNNENHFDPLVVKKDRDKRNANHPPDNTKEFKPVDGSVDQSVAQLANNQDFWNNVKDVFGENKQTIASPKATYVFDDSKFNLTNENNTGTDDRFQPLNIITDKFKDFGPTTTETPIGTDNGLDIDSKNVKEDQMQEVFGSPPYHNEDETETPSPMMTRTKNEPVENTTDTDYRFTSATIIKESYNRMGTGGSSTNIIWFYMYSLSLFVIFV